MMEVEDVGRNLPQLSSTVVEKNTQLGAAERAKTAVKWHSQLEVEMIQKIIAAPKVEPAKRKEQEEDMREKFAESIAGKLIELAKLANIDGEGEEVIEMNWGGRLMTAALEKFRSEEWRSQQQEASNKVNAAAANKDGGVALVPKVIEYNEKNEPQADVETIVCTPERPKTEIIPWGAVAGIHGNGDCSRRGARKTCISAYLHVGSYTFGHRLSEIQWVSLPHCIAKV